MTAVVLSCFCAAKKMTMKVIEMVLFKLAKMLKKKVMKSAAGKLFSQINKRVEKAIKLADKGKKIQDKYLRVKQITDSM